MLCFLLKNTTYIQKNIFSKHKGIKDIMSTPTNNLLNYYQVGDEHPQVIFIHGLLGSGQNWQTFLRVLNHDQKISVAAVDLRGHGKSPHFQGPGEFQIFVDDMQKWLKQYTQQPIYLVGHSMGGKVAMCVAARFPELIKKLMIVDITFEPIRPDVENVIEWMKTVETPNIDPNIAKIKLQQYTHDERLCNFLLTNWYLAKDGWSWRVDLNGLNDIALQLQQLNLQEDWQAICAPITLIRGAHSEHFSELQAQKMLSLLPNNPVQYIILHKSGHWCHADEPQRFRAILNEFIGAKPE